MSSVRVVSCWRTVAHGIATCTDCSDPSQSRINRTYRHVCHVEAAAVWRGHALSCSDRDSLKANEQRRTIAGLGGSIVQRRSELTPRGQMSLSPSQIPITSGRHTCLVRAASAPTNRNAAAELGDRTVAKEGDLVTVNYRCSTEEGQLLYSSEEPISFVIGVGNVMGNPMFKGFDEASRGLAIGESNSFVEMDAGWRDDLVFEVPRDHEEIVRLENEAADSEDGPLQAGSLVELSNGQPAVILEMEGDTVKIDANHPLANLALKFEVEVVSIEHNHGL